MKKFMIVQTLAIFLVIIYLAVGCSLEFSLHLSGFNAANIMEFASGFDLNGSEVRILRASRDSSDYSLVMAVQNKLGFWNCYIWGESNELGYSTISWTRHTQFIGFDSGTPTFPAAEQHLLFYGENATGRVYIPEGKLPSNVAANVEQNQNIYVVHFVAFDYDTDGGSVLNYIQMNDTIKTDGS